MARARNIKPGFFRNADLVELSFEARLLFIGLWTIADRAGRLEDRPKQIKMELFPADNMDCDALLNQLAAIHMVVRYEVDGKRYLQVTNFAKHQNPHRDEKSSTLPDQDGIVSSTKQEHNDNGASTVQALCEQDAKTMAIGLIPDSLIPDSLNKETPLIPQGGIPDGLASAKQRKPRGKKQTFASWAENIRANNEKAISDYKPVWDYASRAGLPTEFVEIAWLRFKDKYLNGSKAKTYIDWRAAFRDHVEGNYLGLWFWSDKDNQFRLTTAGIQADRSAEVVE